MPFVRLAAEIDETARQTATLVSGIADVVAILADKGESDGDARRAALKKLMQALQAEDRINQRCADLAALVRDMGTLGCNDIPAGEIDALWARRTLDELRAAPPARTAPPPGDVDLF